MRGLSGEADLLLGSDRTKVSRERVSVVGDVGGIHPLGPRVEDREVEQLLLRLLHEGFGIRGGRRRLGDRSRLRLLIALVLGDGGGAGGQQGDGAGKRGNGGFHELNPRVWSGIGRHFERRAAPRSWWESGRA